jgi:DMSO/TMAO reductase YedYZ heme-binding membrane subunit
MLTWIVLRAAGIAAYLMLWATVSWGLVGTTSLLGRKVARVTAINIHQFLATAAFVLLGVHIGGLLLDRFVPFTPVDVLLPFHSAYHTVPVAFGIVSMWAVVTVLFSSWLRKHISTKAWRALHLLAVPAFAMALVHGVFAGTDTVRPWMWWGYVATGGSVLFFMLTRALTIGLRPTRGAPPPRSARTREPAAAGAAVAATARQRVQPARVEPRQRVRPTGLESLQSPQAAPVASRDSSPRQSPRHALPSEPAPTSVPLEGPTVIVTAPPGARAVSGESPPTIVVRLELVIEGEQVQGRRRIDVPIRLHSAAHTRERSPHTERLVSGPHRETGPVRRERPDHRANRGPLPGSDPVDPQP